MQRALWLAKQSGITIAYKLLPFSFLGYYYWEPPKPPIILIHRSIEDGPRYLLRSVLWEELGHHFTWQPFSGKVPAWYVSGVQETRALRWAAQHLIRAEHWESARCFGISTVPELAAHFDITTELAEMAVYVSQLAPISCHCPLCDSDSGILWTEAVGES